MPRVEKEIEIESPPGTVWNVLTDPTYLPKLYPNIVTLQTNPPGRAVPGQRADLVARVGGAKIRVLIQFITVDPQNRLVSRAVPGGLFSAFEHIVTLTSDGLRTKARISFDFTIAPEYLSKVPDPALLARNLGENLQLYGPNLKDICELMPLPT